MFNPWLSFGLRAWQIGLEAQSVIALRMLRLAAGGARAEAESSRMVSEKILAAGEAQVSGGGSCHAWPQKACRRWQDGKTVNVYRKRVRANKRRLSRR